MKLGVWISVAGSLLGIVSVSLGAHIYRWEAIAWPAVAAVWALIALGYERMASR